MKHVGKIIIYATLILVLFVVMFPFLYLVLSSLKTSVEFLTAEGKLFPEHITFDNFVEVWNSDVMNIGRMFFNSVWYTCISVIITLLLSSICGYVFARGEFVGKKVFFAIFSSLMFISMGNITIYPTFEILAKFNLTGSLWGLLVTQCFGIPVVNMYIVRGFVNALPKELDEAASIDGCSFIGIFFRIIFPLLRPVMITIGLLAFNSSWNSYIMPSLFTISNPEQQTLMVGLMALKNSSSVAVSWNLLLAGTVIAVVPVLVVFGFGNKYITKGLAAGAVKG